MNFPKNVFAMLMLLGSLCLVTGTPDPAQARPVHITLYPRGAWVQETAVVPVPADRVLQIPLPDTETSTLSFSVEGGTIESIQFMDSSNKHENALKPLEAELKQAQRAVHTCERQLADLDARITNWRRLPLHEGTTPLTDAQLRSRDELAAQQLERLLPQRVALAESLPELKERAARAEDLLNAAGGPLRYGKEARIQLAPGARPNITLHSTWFLSQKAGWTPSYRLYARPESNTVELVLHALLWQQSGENWDNVPLTLCTQAPGVVAPPVITPWYLTPQRPQMTTARAVQAEEAMPVLAMAAPNTMQEQTTSLSWTLSPQNLPSGNQLQLPLKKETLKAEFAYVLRPYESGAAYLTAALTLPQLRYFPAGEATLFVDTTRTGTTHFDLTEDTSRIFFGVDPLVSASMQQNVQQSGTSGLLASKQTHRWDWTIEVYNKHTWPIQARVEDAAPQSRDERITLETRSTPEPRREDTLLVWTVDVPAGSTATIQHQVRSKAPEDLPIRPGRDLR